MARKGKDLFVMLAERHKTRTQGPSGRTKREVDTTVTPRKASAKADGESIGVTLGRWVQGVVRSLRRSDREAPPQRPRTRPSKAAVRPVPRGLLLPGWMLAAMILVAMGGGFALGQVTFGATTDGSLNKPRQGAEAPGRFVEPGQPGYLDPSAAEEELGRYFYVLGQFYGDEKERAARLAQELRARGLHQARIKSFAKDGSIFGWVTLCYVADYYDHEAVLAVLKKHQADLKFDLDPVLRDLRPDTPK